MLVLATMFPYRSVYVTLSEVRASAARGVVQRPFALATTSCALLFGC